MSAPIVIAHAAAAGEAPANTLAGVRASLESAAAMEIDLHLCADGVPVLLHDHTLDRTTNRSGPVRDVHPRRTGPRRRRRRRARAHPR